MYSTNCGLIHLGVNIANPSGNDILVTSDDYGVEIFWNNVHNVRVTIGGRYLNQTTGLCGNYNRMPSDDFVTSNGTITSDVIAFGNSWKVDGDCEDAVVVPDPCAADSQVRAMAEVNCSVLQSPPFNVCASSINATDEGYIADCEYDLCACQENREACLCQAIEGYVAACSARGFNITWLSLPPYKTSCSK